MFLIVQLPIADLRKFAPSSAGRLETPDWEAIDHPDSFIRGFGKMAPRNQSGYGLYGERAFADFNNAAAFQGPIMFQQAGWHRGLRIHPWFRRLYFDGVIAGRFEFGFHVFDDQERSVFRDPDSSPLVIADLAKALHSVPVEIRSLDGSVHLSTVGDCSTFLGRAYLAATTRQSKLVEFPPAETYGSYLTLGRPTFHMRISGDVRVEETRDKRSIVGEGLSELFLASSGGTARNNVIVQRSSGEVWNESASERATRVLFAHLNSLVFAHAQFYKEAAANARAFDRSALKEAVSRMLERFAAFKLGGPEDTNDGDFAAALAAFAGAYTGKTDDLCAKLEDLATKLNAPTIGQKVGGYGKALFELVVTTTVKAYVEGTTNMR